MDIPTAELTGILVCLFFSAFFSASETALTSLSNVAVHQLIEKYPRSGKRLLHWKNNHTGILTTILVGNNITNVTASALAADLAQTYFDNNGIPIAIGIMTFLLLFSGEITPKTFARAYAKSLALPIIHLVLIFHYAFLPLTWILTGFIKLLFLLVGRKNQDERTVTEEDIEYIVSLGGREGAIDKEKENMLSSIFEFTETIAKEIMVPRTDMISIRIDTSYEDVLELTLSSGYSRIPVFEENIDKILGVFYTKNLLPAPGAEEKNGFLKSRLRPAVFIPESKKINQVLQQFKKEHIHMAIVVNEFGGTEGIVTMEDIIEELLGEIQDEFDSEEERLQQNPDGTFLADARVDIENIEESLSLKFPENREYESLGGFLMEVAGEVPTKGWEYNHHDFIFSVIEADLNRVISVHIKPAPSRDDNKKTKSASEDDENLKPVQETPSE